MKRFTIRNGHRGEDAYEAPLGEWVRYEDVADALKDRDRLDWLDGQTQLCEQGTGWIARDSTTGRGFRLHETSGPWNGREPSNDVRAAIDAAMEAQGDE